MRDRIEVVKGWLLKAQSDLTAASLCLANKQSLDTACFHAQQAAEKFLKAYLTAYELDFPFVHNLEKLIELCALRDPDFQSIKPLGAGLTPYAVELRYDSDFWPEFEVASEAYDHALTIKAFVLDRLPPEVALKGNS